MREIRLLIFVLFLVNSAFAQKQLDIRGKIIPLKSTKSDVEKIGKFVKSFQQYVRYETENELLDVYFTSAKCTKTGWNVPSNHVLSFRVYPKKTLLLDDLLPAVNQFFLISNDIGTRIYINAKNGTKVIVSPGEQKVDYISFFPTTADSAMRCEGFPEYSLVSEHYAPSETFLVKNPDTWMPSNISSTLGWLLDDSDKKANVFVYCTKGQMAKCSKIKEQIEKFASIILKSEIKRFQVGVGGYRDNIEIETFLTPKDYPAVVSSPYYPSKL